ncbi:MAG TPA: hypothetical protein VNH38_01200 [Candidatus Dormibacteraeota bacterium]|nr:hypothetical protein [Candidatus Dormibacteraeota bacterium]
MAQFPAEGIPEAQLARHLGMTLAEAARMREILLRRRLVRRTPPGRARAASRLTLTDRGHRGSVWLEQLQSSLPTALFEVVESAATSAGDSDVLPLPGERLAEGPSGPLAWLRHRLTSRKTRLRLIDLDAVPEEGTFERGLLNIWLGTGFFGGAVLVGIFQQTTRGALVALGLGCFMAIVFFARAGVILVRHARSRERRPRSRKTSTRVRHPVWRHHRPRSGGVHP